jgi:single-strand DNA-binding protein
MSNRTITLIGHLGGDPETRYTKTGKMLVEFSVASSEKRTDSDGNKTELTTWFKCTAWNGYADVLDRLSQSGALKKGRQVYVTGPVSASAYISTKTGEPTASLEVMVDKLLLLGKGDRDPE